MGRRSATSGKATALRAWLGHILWDRRIPLAWCLGVDGRPPRRDLGGRSTNAGRGRLSRETVLANVFKLAKSAERYWRRLNGSDRLGQLIEGVRFRDGEPQLQDAA